MVQARCAFLEQRRDDDHAELFGDLAQTSRGWPGNFLCRIENTGGLRSGKNRSVVKISWRQMILAPSAAAARGSFFCLVHIFSGLIEQRIWTKPSLSMELTSVNQLAAQSAYCKFFSVQFSLGFAAVATEGGQMLNDIRIVIHTRKGTSRQRLFPPRLP